MANEGSVGSTHPHGRSWWVVDPEDHFRSAQMDPPSPSPHLLGKPPSPVLGSLPCESNQAPHSSKCASPMSGSSLAPARQPLEKAGR